MVDFEDSEWNDVSQCAKNLICRLLSVRNRPTAYEALQDDFFKP